MSLTGYEVVQDELHTDDGLASKTVLAPTGKLIISGGFRFQFDSTGSTTQGPVHVLQDGPYSGIYSDGSRWHVSVDAGSAGTLRVFAVCVDAS